MENKSEIVRLEEFVDNLVRRYKQLQTKCSALEGALEKREAECEKLKDTIEELRSERGVVGEKVAGLIDRIEQWESQLESDEEQGDDDLEKLQGKLFQDSKSAAK